MGQTEWHHIWKRGRPLVTNTFVMNSHNTTSRIVHIKRIHPGNWNMAAAPAVLNPAGAVSSGHQSESVCQPMNFSKPYVNPRKMTANTDQRNTSNVPVKARTLKMYDSDAPINAAA